MVAYRTISEAAAGLEKWMRILHLQDWELTITLVPQTTFDDRMQAGDCTTRKNFAAAEIRLATLETLDLVGSPRMADMERTLVHELLHCVLRSGRLWPKDVDEHQLNHYEHGIEAMARAFVELDRRQPTHTWEASAT